MRIRLHLCFEAILVTKVGGRLRSQGLCALSLGSLAFSHRSTDPRCEAECAWLFVCPEPCPATLLWGERRKTDGWTIMNCTKQSKGRTQSLL